MRIIARGLCGACYDRHRRHGTLHRHDKKAVGAILRPGRNGTQYRYLWKPGHPLAHADNYVAEHRMVAWDLGWLTDRSDEVHHRNGDGLDNRPENLEVMSCGAHRRHHAARDGTVNQYGWHPPKADACRLCGRPARSGDLCTAHATRLHRYGDPLLVRRVGKSTIAPYRLVRGAASPP